MRATISPPTVPGGGKSRPLPLANFRHAEWLCRVALRSILISPAFRGCGGSPGLVDLVYAGSSGSTRVGTTRTVDCDIPALASGATVTRTFSADAGLLTLGSLVATAQRTASSPTDPNAANDRASRTCTALTSLIVRC
ncbi:hypothetical protein ACIBL3_34165 [Kribbella sp. NPDC050124]|uniref:hypothetical protein n=1 Tax=Kribbella sp. NPDC050124 TaxID=3364114 RepID=UPI0037A3CFFD